VSIWTRIFTRDKLLGWEFVAWALAILIGAGLAMVMVFTGFNLVLGATVCFSVAAMIVLAKIVELAVLSKGHPFWERATFVFLLFGFVGVGSTELIRWIYKNKPIPPPTSTIPKPVTLEELFETDFSNLFKFSATVTVHSLDGKFTLQVPFKVYADFAGKSKFIGFFLQPSPYTYEFCETLAWAPQKSFDDIEHKVSFDGSAFGQQTSLKDLTFSGRVFIYHYDFLSPEQVVALRAIYKQEKLSAQFLGMDYLSVEAKNPSRQRAVKQQAPPAVP
jgi:hypothetical protein